MSSTTATNHVVPDTCRAVQIDKNGDAGVLNVTVVPVPKPSSSQILVRNRAAGVNFIDIYHRTGLYALPLPLILGREAAGEVVAVGDAVRDFKLGDRVAYVGAGTYAEYSVAEENKTVRLDDRFDYAQGAAAMLQGLTALSFAREAYKVRKGDWVLVSAAAGGVGLLLTQIVKHYGGHVIGLTSTEEKAAMVRKAGAKHVLLYDKHDVVAEVNRLTNGEGVHVVYDGVGKSTFDASLATVRRLGSLVSFGNASGKVDPFDIIRLSKNNVRLLRPTLLNYLTTKEEFKSLADELWQLITDGSVDLHIHKAYPLDAVAEAHCDLESRKTTGKLVLTI